MASATLILSLLVLVAVSGVLSRFVRFVPVPLLQIALGVLLAWPARGIHISFDPELFLLIFIPPLLFLDGYLAPKREFARYKVPIIGLALGLVVFTVVAFGYALHWMFPILPLPVAFALAAVLSPTDAVAVSSIVDRDMIPARLSQILQGESLLNDASGLVVFRIAVAAALTGHFSLGETALSFVLVSSGGVLAGFVCLWSTAKILRFVAKVGDIRSEVQVLVLLLLPFAAYLLAERFHASGVLAAVTAGLYLGRSGLFGSLSVPARLTNRTLIEFLSFIFNGSIFLLLGLELPDIIRRVPLELSVGGSVWKPALVVLMLTLILILLRFFWISVGWRTRWVADILRKRQSEGVTTIERLVMAFAGVRGAITLAGVLSMPFSMPDGTAFPGRALCVFIAAGVILCSLILASVALPILARRLTLPQQDATANEEREARIMAAQAAIAAVEGLVDASRDDDTLFDARRSAAEQVIPFYRQRIAAAEATLPDGGAEVAPGRVEGEMRLAAIEAEKNALQRLLMERQINDETLHSVLDDLVLIEAFIVRRMN